MSEAIEGDYLSYDDDEVEESLGDSQQLLNYTQRIRRDLVKDMTTRGMPEDKDERGTLLQALRDMDTTSVQRLKLDVDQQAVDNDRQAQEIVRRLSQNKPRGLAVEDPSHYRHDTPKPDESALPETESVDGETYIGLEQEDAKSFLKKMDPETDS